MTQQPSSGTDFYDAMLALFRHQQEAYIAAVSAWWASWATDPTKQSASAAEQWQASQQAMRDALARYQATLFSPPQPATAEQAASFSPPQPATAEEYATTATEYLTRLQKDQQAFLQRLTALLSTPQSPQQS
jgi:hypothetical protein